LEEIDMAVTEVSRSVRGKFFDTEGYYVERGLFSKQEMEALSRTFMDLHDKGGEPGRYEFKKTWEGKDDGGDGFMHVVEKTDPLAVWPRVMHPHKFMPEAKRMLLEPRVLDLLEELTQEKLLAAQTMFYFKPPNARGQAFHQDNFYLRVAPGTCVAAWVAVDPSDEENGGLQVVPKTQAMQVVCPDGVADPASSWTKEFVRPPEGAQALKLRLQPGDVLFFNGSTIHGSTANTSKDRMRRSFISHYVGESTCEEVSQWYFPLLNRQGQEVGRKEAQGGGPCGGVTEVIH
jgi:hypothetical protein